MVEQKEEKGVEVIEKEIELLPEQTGLVEGTQKENIDDLMFLAENIDKIIAAKNKIRDALLKLAKPGDWTIFKSSTDSGPGKAELGYAGAFRISSTVGITFKNWIARKESGADEKGAWYRWEVTCEALWRGMTVTAYGRAGSRDKFLGKEHGKYKDLSDCNEGDFKIAAIRGAYKEAVKMLLGLHHQNPDELLKMGIPLESAGGYSFGSKETSATDTDKAAQSDIRKWLFEMYGNNGGIELEKLTSFTGKDGTAVKGISKCEFLVGKRLEIAHAKVHKIYDEWSKNQGAQLSDKDKEIAEGAFGGKKK